MAAHPAFPAILTRQPRPPVSGRSPVAVCSVHQEARAFLRQCHHGKPNGSQFFNGIKYEK